MRKVLVVCLVALLGRMVLAHAAEAPRPVPTIHSDWNNVTGTVNTALSVEVFPQPLLRRESPIHDRLFRLLKDLGVDYPRAAAWFPFPRLSVAELEPPANGVTSWDFAQMDPWVADFFAATAGHPVQMNFSTIPQWMFTTDKAVAYPQNPEEIAQKYGGGTQLRDPQLKELTEYFTRLLQWYTKGGFVDEYGKPHRSGHHFRFDNWEVLNEPDVEHHLSPQEYTRIYDAVVSALRRVDPQMTFCGLSLSDPGLEPEYFEYFLDPRNHRPGIPLDMISYHVYAIPDSDETPEMQERTFFAQTDAFVMNVRYIEGIRKRLSPHTKTYINEAGTFTPDPISLQPDIPDSYWNLSAAAFAHLYLELARQGIDRVAMAELNDYPGLVTGTTMSDWKTGEPNARYWVLKLLHDTIGTGDSMVGTTIDPREEKDWAGGLQLFDAQSFVSPARDRKLLVINKRNRPLELRISGARGAQVLYVDVGTASHPPARRELETEMLTLKGYSVAVVQFAEGGSVGGH